MEFEGGKGLVVPTACYSAEKFLDNKKHSREQTEMKITDEVALQTQTWFLTAFVEKNPGASEQKYQSRGSPGAQVLRALHLSINIATSSHPFLLGEEDEQKT